MAKKIQNLHLIIIISLGVILLVVFGIRWWIHLSTHVGTDDSTIAGHVHPISPRVPGTVIAVYFLDNQYVKAGQLLAKLDPRDYQAEVDQAKAALDVAKAQAIGAIENTRLTEAQYRGQVTQAQGALAASGQVVGQSQKSLLEAQANINASRQNLSRTEAELTQAELDLRRYNAVDPRAVSAQQRDTIRTTYDTALANRNSAQASVLQSQARAQQIQKEISANQARVQESQGSLMTARAQKYQVQVQQSQAKANRMSVAQAEASLKRAKLNLSYTKIYAPVTGKVGRKSIEIGQRFTVGQPMLSIVERLIWVIANLKETQLERVRPGQPVDIHVDSFPKHNFEGIVDSISPASGAQFALLPPDNATGNFTKIVQRIPVKIWFSTKSIEGYEELLVPGMSTVITIDTTNFKEPKQR